MEKPFKAYDIRGIYPEEVNEEFALNLGKAVGTYLKGKEIIVGQDGRKSGNKLRKKLIEGILSTGKNVTYIGKVSTPQFYFSLYNTSFNGGVMITASHNPKEYNGFKICESKAVPIFKEHDLPKIEQLVKNKNYLTSKDKGVLRKKNIKLEYKQYFKNKSKPLNKQFNIIADTGNGMGILEIRTLKKIFGNKLKVDVLYKKIDGNFPNHECNPVIKENLIKIRNEVQKSKYDFGIAFDGDADRIVFITKDGNLIPSDLITAVIGDFYAKKNDVVGYEVRTSRVVNESLEEKGIKGKLYPSGHAYIKQNMRQDKAVFAGEKSGHYFYKELNYTDSSLFTVMNMLWRLDEENKSLDEISKPLIKKYVNSGEINYKAKNADNIINEIKKSFQKEAKNILEIDGISIYGDKYFFNLRKSNTEPLIRLTVEGDNKKLMLEIKKRIEEIINNKQLK